jgi:hypothetical protein
LGGNDFGCDRRRRRRRQSALREVLIGDKGLNIVGDETKKKSDEQLLKMIAEGSGKMPASKLTKEEQKQALGYARSLAK